MSNNLPTLRFVFDRRKKATLYIASSVELEIYFSRDYRKRLSTGVKLYAGQWDDKLRVINRPDGVLINAKLTELYKRQEQVFYEMYAQGLSPTSENYDLFIKGEIEKDIPNSF